LKKYKTISDFGGYSTRAVLGKPMKIGEAAGVYLHIPFCRSRCSYCSSPPTFIKEIAEIDYVSALQEISEFEITESKAKSKSEIRG